MRDDFTAKVKKTLAERVNLLCSNPVCRKMTSGPNHNDDKATLIGVAAHITAASVGGPRYNDALNSTQRKNINNGIWLCHNCSDLIDKDETRFTAEKLASWKSETENFVHQKILTGQNDTGDALKALIIALRDLNSEKKLSAVIPDIFEIAIVHNFPELSEICSRELNGWYASDLPALTKEFAPKYRIKKVFLSFAKLRLDPWSRNATAQKIFEELSSLDYIMKIELLFPESIIQIEDNIKELSHSEEDVMRQEIKKNNLKFGNEVVVQHGAEIWYSSFHMFQIELGLRQELVSKILSRIDSIRKDLVES